MPSRQIDNTSHTYTQAHNESAGMSTNGSLDNNVPRFSELGVDQNSAYLPLLCNRMYVLRIRMYRHGAINGSVKYQKPEYNKSFQLNDSDLDIA